MTRKARTEWLDLMLRSRFFDECEDHRELRKCEMNTYCIDCDTTMCQHCLLFPTCSKHVHANHKLLQIRRYVYQNVVRIHDMQNLLDCSKIQPFVVNGAKVVLLNKKRGCKANFGKDTHVCKICQRSVTDPNQYCSIACKVSENSGAVEIQGSGSLFSSVTMDLHQSNSWCSLDPICDGNHDCWKNITLLKRKRKGVPRRSSLY